MKVFSTELLRTLVVVVEEGSFTAAGARLGRTQSAVTAQMKRLEEQADCLLLNRNTRSVRPTSQGEVMLDSARQILALHDNLRQQLGIGKTLSGRLRIGVSEGYLNDELASSLRRFGRVHSGVQIELHVDATKNLQEQLDSGRLDIMLGVHCSAEGATQPLWSERLVWGFSDTHELPASGPLPLVFAPEPCPYRTAAIAALASTRVLWRVACVSPSSHSCITAAKSGLGVVALRQSELGPGLRDVGVEASLPELPDAWFSLRLPSDGPSRSAFAMADALRSAIAGSRIEGSPVLTPTEN